MEDVHRYYAVEMNGMIDPTEMNSEANAKVWAKEIASRHPHAVIKVLLMKTVIMQELWTNVE